MSSWAEIQKCSSEQLKEMTDEDMDRMSPLFPTYKLKPNYMRGRIEKELAKKDEGMLGEALTLAINNGNNLDKLRRKLAHDAKQLARVNDIIKTIGLRSTGDSKYRPTLSRLSICFPEEAFKLAHEIRPKLRYGSQTPEAFPYAMRQNGFGALIPKDMHQLYEAYSLYKAQNSGEPINSDLIRNMRYYVSRAQDGFSEMINWEASRGKKLRRKFIKEPKYGIFTKDGELVEVLKQMAAEWRRIAQPDLMVSISVGANKVSAICTRLSSGKP